jgi:hypothetical protein
MLGQELGKTLGKSRRATILLVLFSGGCLDSVIQEATTPVTNPGGTVQAEVVSGQARTTTALGNSTQEPMTIQGASAQLTFSLTAADTLGGTADTDLKNPPASTTLSIHPGGRNALEVHLDGGGCLASTGTVHLTIDTGYHLAGDFDADGTVADGSDSCHITGTLANVPEQH